MSDQDQPLLTGQKNFKKFKRVYRKKLLDLSHGEVIFLRLLNTENWLDITFFFFGTVNWWQAKQTKEAMNAKMNLFTISLVDWEMFFVHKKNKLYTVIRLQT